MLIISIIIAVIFLGILVFLHEYAHFIIAKKSGIKVPIFSIGFGPPIYKKQVGETEYRICAIPFGGYVKLSGMEPNELKGEDYEFYSKKPLIRILVLIGGPFANIFTGFLIYLFVIWFAGIDTPRTTMVEPTSKSVFEKGDKILELNNETIKDWFDIEKYTQDSNTVVIKRGTERKKLRVSKSVMDSLLPLFPPVIGGVEKEGPAYKLGLNKGDTILSINGRNIQYWEDMRSIISSSPGESLIITYKSRGEIKKGVIIPTKTKMMQGDSIITIGIIGVLTPFKSKRISLPSSLKFASLQFIDTSTKIFRVFGLLARRKVSPRELGGPLSIVYLTKKSLNWGWKNLFFFLAYITINLGIINLIPIPPLDGSHALLGLIEMITRKKPNQKWLNSLEAIGFFILIFIMLYVTMNDILRFLFHNV